MRRWGRRGLPSPPSPCITRYEVFVGKEKLSLKPECLRLITTPSPMYSSVQL